MDKECPSRGRRYRSLPCGMLGMLVAITAIELFLMRQSIDLTHIVGTDWNLAGRRAGRETLQSEILCFGDSLMKHGALPRVLEARTGRRCYSLAISAGQAPADFFLLRRALEAGSRPSAVLVDFKPNLLEVDPGPNVWMYQQLFNLRECWEFAKVAGDGQLFSQVLLGRILPSVRGRNDIRGGIVAALDGRSISWGETSRSHMRNWRVNRGGQVTPSNPGFQAVDTGKDEYQYLYKAPWKPSRLMLTYVRRFLRLAAKHDIQVYWLMPPFCPETKTRREQLGLESAYSQLAHSIQAQFPEVIVLDGRRAEYPKSVFIDPTHLDWKGGTSLSIDVAEFLRKHPKAGDGSPRWVALPGYRERSIDLPLEDLGESLIAVRSHDETQRR